MIDEQIIKMKRESLYQEIWTVSASGVAKKYNIPYSELLRICKEADIPIPPSGYWTKLSFGKSVEKTDLHGSDINEVILPINVSSKRKRKQKTNKREHKDQEILEDVIEIENINEDIQESKPLEKELPQTYFLINTYMQNPIPAIIMNEKSCTKRIGRNQ